MLVWRWRPPSSTTTTSSGRSDTVVRSMTAAGVAVESETSDAGESRNVMCGAETSLISSSTPTPGASATPVTYSPSLSGQWLSPSFVCAQRQLDQRRPLVNNNLRPEAESYQSPLTLPVMRLASVAVVVAKRERDRHF